MRAAWQDMHLRGMTCTWLSLRMRACTCTSVFSHQFTMVAMFAGFGFNPVGLICHNNMKFINRIAKIMLLVASVYMLAFGLKMAEDKGLNPGP